MRHKFHIAVVLALACLACITGIFVPGIASAAVVEESYFNTLQDSAFQLAKKDEITLKPAYMSILSDNGHVLLPKEESKGFGSEVIMLAPNSEFTFRFEMEYAGGYHVLIDYMLPEVNMRDKRIGFLVNGEFQFYESRNVKLSEIWKDVSQEYSQDAFGNDIYPSSERVFRWQSSFLNHSMFNLSIPLIFSFRQGMNTITIENGSSPMLIGNIRIVSEIGLESYSEYKLSFNNQAEVEEFFLSIPGHLYFKKSESHIRGGKGTDYNLYPYHPAQRRINHLPGEVWEIPGDSVTYRFRIPKDGFYKIHLRYKQDFKEDMPVFKRILINGNVPFIEFNEYAFPHTPGGWENRTLTVSGENIRLFLTEGYNEITIQSTASPYFETYERLRNLIHTISDLSLQIQKVTGNRVDRERDWNIIEFVPDLSINLLRGAEILKSEHTRLLYIGGETDIPSISALGVASGLFRQFAEEPDTLVDNLDRFSQGSGSISHQIAEVLTELLEQPISIANIYVTGEDYELPPARISFFRMMIEEIRKLFYSFFARQETGQILDSEKLNVWVNRSIPHVETLREMVDSEYTPNKGVVVNISTMPDEQRLLLAVAAGRAPDIVLGASSYRPFDFALRGALRDFREFDDFGLYAENLNPEMFIPFVIDDRVYGIPETANITLLFYRKDILDKLGLEVPDTWQETLRMLPALSRYGMNFNTLFANLGGFKHFGATVPLIQQFGGPVYSEDGASVAFGDPRTVEAFRFMTDLFTRYSLAQSIPNFFNNFRYGVTPIGMSDFNTYILLKNAAPELAGQWGIAPAIGIETEDGRVLRYQPAVNTASIMMSTTQKPEEGWDFIKWWMSTDVQIRYADTLRLRYGPEFLWNTANIEALMETAIFDDQERDVIYEQYAHIREIPRNPAYFAVERELSNAWNRVVFSGVSPRIALDQAIIFANREITRKLKEFGYMDLHGNLLRPFDMSTAEKVMQWKEGEE